MDKNKYMRKVEVDGKIGYMHAYDVDGKPTRRGLVVAPDGATSLGPITGRDDRTSTALSRHVVWHGIYKVRIGPRGEIVEVEHVVS